MNLILCFSLLAFADIPPSDTQTCRSAKAGDSCRTDEGKSGACTEQTCSRLDYSNGTPPTSVSEPCLVCDADAKPSNASKKAENGCSTVGAAGASALGLALLLAAGITRRA